MPKQDSLELAKSQALKRLRSRVRLEMSLRADVLLNELEPPLLAAIEERAQAGMPFQVEDLDNWVREASRLGETPSLPSGS